MEPQKYVSLTDTELLALDGMCSEKAQEEVEKAKYRLDAVGKYIARVGLAASYLIGDAVYSAMKRGRLKYSRKHIDICDLCGEEDYDAIELDDGNVFFNGRTNIGCCHRCMVDIKPLLKNALKDVVAELPEQIMGVQKYKREKKMKCSKCGWTGHTGQMPTGTSWITGTPYPKCCPNDKCHASNTPFSVQIKELGDHAFVYAKSGRLVPVEEGND